MANVVSTKIVRDGYRNAVAAIYGILDTGATSLVIAPVIQLSDFTSSDPGYPPLNGFRIDTIKYSISDSISAILFWNATADEIIAGLYGRGKLDFEPDGALQPDQAAAGYDGALNLELYNIGPPASTKQTFTILLEMTKLYKV